MLLHLSDRDNEPLQAQIVRQVRTRILAGDLAAGTDLPSIRTLARDQRVSVITVQRAYEILEREGLIHARRGKGVFVSDLSPRRRRDLVRERFRDAVAPHLRTALAEGLSSRDVRGIVGDLLQEGGSP